METIEDTARNRPDPPFLSAITERSNRNSKRRDGIPKTDKSNRHWVVGQGLQFREPKCPAEAIVVLVQPMTRSAWRRYPVTRDDVHEVDGKGSATTEANDVDVFVAFVVALGKREVHPTKT